jgi:hypothetical protein
LSKAFKITGLKGVLRNLDKVAKKVDGATQKALTDEANDVLKEAMIQAPVDTGDLRRSGTVGKITKGAATISIEIGFHTNYALYVHEDLQAHHPTGKAKFLEDPVNAAVPGLAGRIKKRLGTVF